MQIYFVTTVLSYGEYWLCKEGLFVVPFRDSLERASKLLPHWPYLTEIS